MKVILFLTELVNLRRRETFFLLMRFILTILALISRMLILDLLSLSKNHTAAALVRPQ
ncbi:MAG: hypothetical protein ABR881_22395 [Candidatus Sulfotelmatobacter sp.]|jgi:hypothetical protein